MDTKSAVTEPRTAAFTSANPRNLEFPEIVTVTEKEERIEATEEKKLVYKTGTPKGTVLVKKVSTVHTTIRTTTPYTGTV